MNFRKRLLRLCTMKCGLLVMLFSLAILSPAFGALVDPKIKESTDADQPANKALIAAAVKGAVAELTGGDPAKRTSAREALISEVNAPGGAGAAGYTSQFFDVYTKELNTQLMPLATGNDVVVRLNAAIVIARVAEKADNSWMLPVTLVFLTDKSDAVVNWGLKAARYILPPVLQAGMVQNQAKLITAIKSHADNPTLLPLVYEAMSLNYLTVKGNVPGRDKMVAAIVPEVLSVLATRLALYENQVPPEPLADEPATGFLSYPSTWAALKNQPKLQLQVVQAMSDLIGLAGQRAAAAQQPQRDQLEQVVRQAASALGAIALNEKATSATTIYNGLVPITKVGPNSPNLVGLVQAVPTLIKTYPAWATIKAAPIVKAATTTTAPSTTAPAAAPVTAAAPAK